MKHAWAVLHGMARMGRVPHTERGLCVLCWRSVHGLVATVTFTGGGGGGWGLGGVGLNANPAAPAARSLSHYHGTWEIVPFVNGTLEWGVVIAPFFGPF